MGGVDFSRTLKLKDFLLPPPRKDSFGHLLYANSSLKGIPMR